MPNLEVLNIDELQPTHDTLLVLRVVDYSLKSSRNQKIDFPEVWRINNEYYISDGHHRLFLRYLDKETQIPVFLYKEGKENLGFGAYESVVAYLLKGVKKARQKQITHISQLQIV